MYQSPYNIPQPVVPQLTWPLNGTTPIAPQPIPGPQLTRVNGLDSAKAFPTVANAMYALFDENDDILYIKQTDASNYPTIKRYRFVLEEDKPVQEPKYVTVEEFNKFKEELLNAKQSVWSSAESSKPGKSLSWADLTNQEHDGDA